MKSFDSSKLKLPAKKELAKQKEINHKEEQVVKNIHGASDTSNLVMRSVKITVDTPGEIYGPIKTNLEHGGSLREYFLKLAVADLSKRGLIDMEELKRKKLI